VVLSLVAIMLLTYLVLGVELIDYFFTKVFRNLLESWKVDYYNQSLSAFLMRQFDNKELIDVLRLLVSTTLALFSVFIIYIHRKKEDRNLLSISLLIVLGLLINSFSWQHHFVWLIIPFLITFLAIKQNNFGKIYYLILAVIYVLVASNLKNPDSVPILLQSHVFYGASLLYILNTYLIFKGNLKVGS
jgi:hypothetical protein